MKNILDEFTKLFSNEKKYFSNGNLLKNKIIGSALSLEPTFLKLLLKMKILKKLFLKKWMV